MNDGRILVLITVSFDMTAGYDGDLERLEDLVRDALDRQGVTYLDVYGNEVMD